MADGPDRYCGTCGRELSPEDQFCRNCGRPVLATAEVPTPEADVSVPPLPQQAVASQQSPRAAEQTAAPRPSPTPEPQERPQWRWKWARGPIILFLGSVIVTSLLDAVATRAGAGGSTAESMGRIVGYATALCLTLLLTFVLIWLILGGLVYLVARLIGRRPSFFWVLFDWWVTVVVVAPILLFGPLGGWLFGF